MLRVATTNNNSNIALIVLLEAVAVVNGWNFQKGNGDKHQQDSDVTVEHATQHEPLQGLTYNRPRLYEYIADRSQGTTLVDFAMKELQQIPKSQHKRQRRQSGLLSTALHYIQLAIPTGPAKAPSESQATPTTTIIKSHNNPLSAAVEMLQTAALRKNPDAMYILAEMNFFGDYNHPRDLHAAYRHYQDLASIHGNATAQYMLALYHSTGLGDVVPRDQAKALLYHTFAAMGGDVRSEMAVAYRYHSGVGTIKSCEKAVEHYKRVSDKAIEWHRSGPPGGQFWVSQAWRIADEHGGVFGEGASASSAGLNAFRPSAQSDAHAAIGDVIEYLDLMAQKGDYKAAFNLGRIYYEGQRGLDQNLDMAKKYFFLVASKYWKRDGRVLENFKPGIEKTAGKAAAYIGRMYLRGEGVSQNFSKAREWFKRGIKHRDPI